MAIKFTTEAFVPDPRKTAIHIKGFGSRLDYSDPDTAGAKGRLIQLLHHLQPDLLVWDGDNYAADSFTAAMLEAYESLRATSSPGLVAFLREEDQARFEAAWADCNVPITVHLCDNAVSWEQLGAVALQGTRSRTVLSFGGGGVLAGEFRAAGTNVMFHLVPVSRPTAAGGTETAALLAEEFQGQPNLRVVREVHKPILITVPVGNNPARCRFVMYHKGLEELIDMRLPNDYGGLRSETYARINPLGKIPALILPWGETLFESKVITSYLLDRYSDVGPSMIAPTPELRALSALINQIHDIYIASANSTDPACTATQGCMYRPVDMIDAPSRAAKVAELWKQLGVLDSLIRGPFAVGEEVTEADAALYPTLGCFIPFMMPRVFGWSNPMDSDALPTLRSWLAAVEELPAAQRVKQEMAAALQVWEDSGRFPPIIEQVAAHPDLRWVFP